MDYRKIIIVGENNIGRSFMAECILRGILQKRNCQNIEVVSEDWLYFFRTRCSGSSKDFKGKAIG